MSIPSNPYPAKSPTEEKQVVSPFAQSTTTIRPARERGGLYWPLWIVSGCLVLLLGAIGVYFMQGYLNDPYRTLPPFSIDKYLSDYRPLAGSKFKGDFKVSADLGWKEKTGRLMVFTGQTDNRPVLVLIPPRLSGIVFTKGQLYLVAVEVGEGGLIYADSCEKE